MSSSPVVPTDAVATAPSGMEASRVPAVAVRRAGRRPLVWLFAAASFVGAALVFLVQPMVAKMVLPVLGGSPAVWNTALVFFQGMLLAGYTYAHFSYRWLGAGRQPAVHLVVLLLPLLALPLALPDWSAPATGVPLWLLGVLAVAAGAPYFAVATAGPLLQRWFSATSDPDAGDPYFLYATGNAGSLAGLLAYPFLVEPLLAVGWQSRVWTVGYLLFLALAAACAWVVLRSRPDSATAPVPGPRTGPPPATAAGPGLSAVTRLRWVGLAFIPSSLLLGVTTYVTTDVAAVPLLWVVPLALYLATFILAFARRGWRVAAWFRRWLPVAVLPALAAVSLHMERPVLPLIGVHLAALFAVGAACHSRLAEERPPVERLTEFYLLISLGGVLGGAFNALLAPVLFDSLVEYPLVLVLALSATCVPASARRRLRVLTVGLVPAMVAFIVLATGGLWLASGGRAGTPWAVAALLVLAAAGAAFRLALPFTRALAAVVLVALAVAPSLRPALYTERTFFGMHRVAADGEWHLLMHGTTLHGAQDRHPERRGDPATYYHRDGPAGDIFAARSTTDRVALVGLGTGALAAHLAPGQPATFLEIDPAVVHLARDTSLFSYLALSPGDVAIVVGDGRHALAREPAAAYDLVLLDAFSSDAIPVHLLTREAVETYLARLRPGGLVAFHISNRYLDLEPVLAAIARSLGLEARLRDDPGGEGRAHGPSRWLVMAPDAEALGPLARDERWIPPQPRERHTLWTDDFSNILGVLRRW
jgi:SAM-dependent methyltransferase